MNALFMIRFRVFARWLLTAACVANTGAASAQEPRGDGHPGVDTLRLAQHHWQQAGAVPDTSRYRPAIVVRPGRSIAKAACRLYRRGGGTVVLAPGTHRLYRPLLLPAGVVLRGAHRDSSRLAVYIKAPFVAHESGKRTAAVVMKKVQQAGVENLTILYNAATFAPNDKDSGSAPWDRTVFHVPERRDTLLFVDLVLLDSAAHCWIKDCNLLWAGCDPVHITASRFITCSNNYVDRAYNKFDLGQGYYNIIRSEYVLVANEWVRRIRHFGIHRGSRYVVVRNSRLEVDLNFHNADGGFNLIEGNTIRIPAWHSWNAFQRGDRRQHGAPGPWNLLFANDARNKDGRQVASGSGQVFCVNTNWDGGNTVPASIPVPQAGTFLRPSAVDIPSTQKESR